jgi:hypothetical protein
MVGAMKVMNAFAALTTMPTASGTPARSPTLFFRSAPSGDHGFELIGLDAS